MVKGSGNKEDHTSEEIINEIVLKIMNDESIAVELIEHFNDPVFETTLYTNGFRFLEEAIRARVKIDNGAYVICLLSYIALKYYDGDLHSKIVDLYYRYRGVSSPSREVIQNRGVYRVTGPYRKVTKYFDPKSHVAVPIVLSCVPHHRLGDLYVIAYDIYKKKLLFDEDLTDDQIRQKVAELLHSLDRHDMISDADTIKGTTYLMSKYTQSCIHSGKCEDALIEILTTCIRSIINYLSRPEAKFEISAYYEDAYNEWVSNFENNAKEIEHFQKSRNMSMPYFRLDPTHVVTLVTGKYNMDDIYDPKDVYIALYHGNAQIRTIKPSGTNDILYADDSIGGYIINGIEIPLEESPLSSFSYKIFCGDQELYSSRDKLHRKNIFFDGHGREVRPGTVYNGEIFVVSNSGGSDIPGELDAKREGYNVFRTTVDSERSFMFDGEPYIFHRIKDPQTTGYEVPWLDFTTVDGKTYPVFARLSFLIPASCELDDVGVTIDKDFEGSDLSEAKARVSLYSHESGGMNVYKVTVSGFEAGFHTVEIFNQKTSVPFRGAKFSFIIDPVINKKFIQEDPTGVCFDINSALRKNDPLLYYEYGCLKKEENIFVKNLGHGHLNIYPSAVCYSLDGVTWHSPDNLVYLCNFQNPDDVIHIIGPSSLDAFCVRPGDEWGYKNLNLEPDLDSGSNNKYILHLGYLNTIKNEEFARIVFECAGRKLKHIPLAFYPKIDWKECHRDFDPVTSKHQFSVAFEGAEKIYFKLVDENDTEKTVFEGPIKSGELIEIADDSVPLTVDKVTARFYLAKSESLFETHSKVHFIESTSYYNFRSVYVKKDNIKIDEDTGIGTFSFDFNRAEKLTAVLTPAGFKKDELLRVDIKPNETVKVNLSKELFRDFKLALYTIPETEEESLRCVRTYNISTKTGLIGRHFAAKQFITVDGKVAIPNYAINFQRIEEIDGKRFIRAELRGNTKGVPILLPAVPDVNEFFEKGVDMYQFKSNKIIRVKYHGRTIIRVVIER